MSSEKPCAVWSGSSRPPTFRRRMFESTIKPWFSQITIEVNFHSNSSSRGVRVSRSLWSGIQHAANLRLVAAAIHRPLHPGPKRERLCLRVVLPNRFLDPQALESPSRSRGTKKSMGSSLTTPRRCFLCWKIRSFTPIKLRTPRLQTTHMACESDTSRLSMRKSQICWRRQTSGSATSCKWLTWHGMALRLQTLFGPQ